MSMVNNAVQSPTTARNIREISNQRLEQQDKTQKTASQDNSMESKAAEYVPGKKKDSTGLYRLGKDSDGNSKILYDDPAKKSSDAKAAPAKVAGNPRDAEECTANTDKVDAEIKKLKDKAAALEQQMAQAADDPVKQEKLKKQLEQVKNELSTKDNDSYRRQHTEFTGSQGI